MPALARTDRWRTFIDRPMAAKGGSLKDVQALDDIFPTLSVLDETQGELHWLRGELLWSTWATATSAAAQSAWVQVTNPVGSGRLVVVQSFRIFQCATTNRIRLGITNGVLCITPEPAVVLDTRHTPTAGGSIAEPPATRVLQSPQATVLGSAATFAIVGVTATVMTPQECLVEDVILKPGYQLTVSSEAVGGGGFDWTATGYERVAEPLELA